MICSLARVDLVETLIRGGADPACKNKAGKTPADLLEENMAKNPHPDLIKIKKTLADVQSESVIFNASLFQC